MAINTRTDVVNEDSVLNDYLRIDVINLITDLKRVVRKISNKEHPDLFKLDEEIMKKKTKVEIRVDDRDYT